MPLLEAVLREISIQIWMTAAGIALMIIGFALGYYANRSIAENWSPVVDKTKEQKLTTSGVYAVVRHPFYLSGLLLLMGRICFLEIHGHGSVSKS